MAGPAGDAQVYRDSHTRPAELTLERARSPWQTKSDEFKGVAKIACGLPHRANKMGKLHISMEANFGI